MALPRVFGFLRMDDVASASPAVNSRPRPKTIKHTEAVVDRSYAALAARPTGRAGSFVLRSLESDTDIWHQRLPVFSAMLEREISRKLRPGDMLEVGGEGQYLVLFSSADPIITHTQQDQIIRAFNVAAQKLASTTPVTLTGFVAEYDAERIEKQDGPPAKALISYLARVEQENRRALDEERTARLHLRKVVFAPVSHSRTGVVVFSRCALNGTAPQEQLTSIVGLADQEDVPISRYEYDALLLKKAIAGYAGLRGLAGARLALVPVSLSTLQSEATEGHFLTLLAAMPVQFRAILMLELAGLPPNWVTSAVPEAVAILSKFAKRVVVQLPLDTRNLDDVVTIGSWGISADLSGCRSTDQRLSGMLSQFTFAATGAGMNSIAYGVDSAGLATMARNAGFVFLSGGGVMPPTTG